VYPKKFESLSNHYRGREAFIKKSIGHQSLPRFDGDFYTIEKSTAERIAPPRNRMPDSMGTKNKILPRTDHAPNFSKIREKKRPSVVIKSHYNNTIELN
jgi:hypothetical protein